MRILLIISLLIGFGGIDTYGQDPPPPLIYVAPHKSEFKEFISKDNSFQITFAGVPKIEEQELANNILYKSYKVYRKGSNSTINTLDYPSELDNRDQIYKLFKAEYLKPPKTKLESESNLKLDGIDGIELNFSQDLKYLKVVILVYESRIYIFECDVTNWHILSDEKKRDFFNESSRFLNSFKLIIVDKVVVQDLDTFIGSTIENEYKNNFFGFSLQYPQGWQYKNKEEIKKTIETGIELLKTDNDKNNEELLSSIKQEIILFSTSNIKKDRNFGIGVVKQPNQNILSKTIALKTKDIFLGNDNVKLAEDLEEININGVNYSTFSVISFDKIKSKIYLTMKRGYSISFVLTFINEEGKNDLELVMKTVKFVE